MSSPIKDLFGVRFKGNNLVAKVFFNAKHPAFPTTFFGLIALTLSIYALGHGFGILSFLSFFAIGLVAWTLTEYMLHRFVFHWTSAKEPWRTIVAGLHLEHHQDPSDKYLIIASPLVALLLSGVLFGIFILATSFLTASVIMAGLYSGYILYEWVHYGTHQYKWQSKVGRYLTHHHLYHHFKRPDEAFGVTSGFWDRIFGTKKSFQGLAQPSPLTPQGAANKAAS